jgi:hypothetical protein
MAFFSRGGIIRQILNYLELPGVVFAKLEPVLLSQLDLLLGNHP